VNSEKCIVMIRMLAALNKCSEKHVVMNLNLDFLYIELPEYH
jgi:hypothetical protein